MNRRSFLKNLGIAAVGISTIGILTPEKKIENDFFKGIKSGKTSLEEINQALSDLSSSIPYSTEEIKEAFFSGIKAGVNSSEVVSFTDYRNKVHINFRNNKTGAL